MIAGVLLAAGAGTRFGGRKLLAPLADGTPIAVRAARVLRDGVDSGVAVVRPTDLELASLLEREGFEVAFFPRASEGMGASLAFGVSAASSADGWLVALADMPFLRSGTVEELSLRVRAGAWIAAPTYRGRRGHPVGFARGLFSDLVRLGGDEGAKSLLATHASRVELLECDDPGILLDIDTLGDLDQPHLEV